MNKNTIIKSLKKIDRLEKFLNSAEELIIESGICTKGSITKLFKKHKLALQALKAEITKENK